MLGPAAGLQGRALYRNQLPGPQCGILLWYHFGVPHPSEVPHLFFEIADPEGALSVITGLITEIRHLPLLMGICFKFSDNTSEPSGFG